MQNPERNREIVDRSARRPRLPGKLGTTGIPVQSALPVPREYGVIRSERWHIAVGVDRVDEGHARGAILNLDKSQPGQTRTASVVLTGVEGVSS